MGKGKPRRDGGPDVDEQRLDEYWLDGLFQVVETGEDFAVFALALQENARRHHATWLNANLDAYLGAIATYAHERGPFIDAADAALPRQNPWKVAAEVLYNARLTKTS